MAALVLRLAPPRLAARILSPQVLGNDGAVRMNRLGLEINRRQLCYLQCEANTRRSVSEAVAREWAQPTEAGKGGGRGSAHLGTRVQLCFTTRRSPLLTSSVTRQDDTTSFSTFCTSKLSPKKRVLAPVSPRVLICREPLILTNYKMRTHGVCAPETGRGW